MAKIDTNVLNAKPGAYLWEVPGRPVGIYVSLDVVDRLLQDVMRGFGAVPKRGAEVGGILLGKSITGGIRLVEVEDYELIPIEYKRGPSYLLSDSDGKAFEETYGRLRHGFKNGYYPVGFFRSHTRDTVGLGPEDLDLIARFLPEPDKVALLIRPFATKASLAGFYFREDGKFQSGPPLVEFPFRRKDLAGEGDASLTRAQPQAERPLLRETSEKIDGRLPDANAGVLSVIRRERPPGRAVAPVPEKESGEPEDSQVEARQAKGGWMWLPLSFIFLLVGVLLGFETATTLRPQQPARSGGDPFSVSLSISKDGDNLNVRWDRQAAAIRAARSGVLAIDDGAYSKTVELDSSQLQTGSVVYRHTSPDVKFRLELTLNDRDTLFEKLEWKE